MGPLRTSPSTALRLCGFLLAVAFLFSAVAARAEDPKQIKPVGYVMDGAEVLSPSTISQLTALCTEVDQKAHAQIAVVVIKSLDGRSIEEFSVDLATQLRVGPKETDRGVLILMATEDRQYRIEVGYGLEGILPDAKAGDIGRTAMPYLRQKNYDAAAILMTREVADVIAADSHVTLTSGTSVPSQGYVQNEQKDQVWNSLTGIILLLVFFVVWNVLTRRFSPYASRGRRGSSGWWIGPMIGGGWGGGFGGGGFGGGGSGGGFGGFGGGSFGGGGASGSW
ncbi:MAG: TPM domain-containing protein [Candidatus Acidiferrales bacterium]